MLIVACAAGCAWVGAAVPVLGILCGVLAVPALLRTGNLVVREATEQPSQAGVALKVLIFFESLLGIGWIAIACTIYAVGFAAPGFALGAAACIPFTSSEEIGFQVGLWLAIGSGAVFGISMLIFCLRIFWSERRVFFPSES